MILFLNCHNFFACQESERLLSALSSMCTKKNTDICIQCGDQGFYCHAVILKARSEMFFRILESSSKPNGVNITEVNPDVMEKVIPFIYSGQLDINKDSLVHILEAAVKLEVPTLPESWREFLVGEEFAQSEERRKEGGSPGTDKNLNFLPSKKS